MIIFEPLVSNLNEKENKNKRRTKESHTAPIFQMANIVEHYILMLSIPRQGWKYYLFCCERKIPDEQFYQLTFLVGLSIQWFI